MKNRVSPKLIAALASVFVIILGLSVWGIVSATSSDAGGLFSSVNDDANQGASGSALAGNGDDSSASAATSGAGGSVTSEQSGTTAGEQSGNADASTSPDAGGATGAEGAGTGAEAPAANSENGGSFTYQEPDTVIEVVGITLTANSSSVPGGGILVDASLQLDPGTTVLEALRLTGALVSVRSTAMGTYVVSIEGYGEGLIPGHPQSGWTYWINGSKPGYSCDKYVLSDGDRVEWRYVENP
jgi:hypothetical protein